MNTQVNAAGGDANNPHGQSNMATSFANRQEEQSLIDLSTLRAMLWRQRWILVVVTGLAVLAGLIFTILTTPIYFAEATVRIDTQNAEVIEGQNLLDPYVGANEMLRYLETLKAVIVSRSMADRVVDDLELYNNEDFLGEIGERPANINPKDWESSRREGAALNLMGSVSVDLPMNTRIIGIGFLSTDQTLAANIANSYVDNFLSDNVSRSVEANAYAQKFLGEQIADTREKLRDSEIKAIEYARANKIIGQLPQSAWGEDIGVAPTLTITELESTSQQLSEARAARIAAEQRWRTVSNVSAAQLPEVQENSAIEAMKSRVGLLSAQLADLRERYRDEYPAIRGIRAEIGELESRIQTASAEIKQGIRSQYEIARGQEAELASEVRKVSAASLDEQDRRVQYNLIGRDAAAARQQLGVLLERYNQLASAASFQSNDATLLDKAQVPYGPASPNLFSNLFLSLVAGIGLAFALAVMREVFDDRLRSIEDVERRLRLPALGQTPYISKGLSEELESAFSPISEAYSSIRASLDFALPKQGRHVIQFTSSQMGEGKTTTAVEMAEKFAVLGRKVLLIDLDLRRPSVAKTLGMERPKSGVVDVLLGRTTLEKAVVKGSNDNLDILLVSEIPSNPVEILSSGLLPEFLEKYGDQYDMIMIDSSPVLGLADAPLLSRFVTGVVFVVEANRTHTGQVRQAIRRLRDSNANITGVLLTKFRALEAGKEFNYQYYYYAYNEE